MTEPKPSQVLADTASAYDVGYKRPPRASRFKKGRSGNPTGRPKGKRNLATDLGLALNETVVVLENGRRRTITKREAICRQLTNRSAGGDLAALRLLIPLMTQIDAVTVSDGFALDPAQERALAETLFAQLGNLRSEPERDDES